uniref:3'-5' exonuclease domain-containing protein n=1 Tax=Vannella robusta TaxID=1487602 RepID=A0A7S4IIT2_9EUKA|mmetsp:Transcript_3156/g.3884  ORF Transcript_3156/g.3884 Transcript_3156/m.3884 type:complete len:245 (+) Transcript_3156:1-735(+)
MLVATQEQLSECLRMLKEDLRFCKDRSLCTEADEVLYCDFEGVSMSRSGEMCIAQFGTTKHTFVVDLVVLGKGAWDTEIEGVSLRSLLESPVLYKIVFDPRNDSDSLYHQFDIKMQSVICLQLMHIAIQRQEGRIVEYNTGLNTLLRFSIPGLDNCKMASIKQAGREMFNQNMNLWRERPLPEILLQYSELDIEALVPLYTYFSKQLNPYWMKLVLKHSENRVLTYLNPQYDTNNPANRFAPSF